MLAMKYYIVPRDLHAVWAVVDWRHADMKTAEAPLLKYQKLCKTLAKSSVN
jgi:hypothetical protein